MLHRSLKYRKYSFPDFPNSMEPSHLKKNNVLKVLNRDFDTGKVELCIFTKAKFTCFQRTDHPLNVSLIFFFHSNSMKLGEVLVHIDIYNFTNFQ